MTFQSGQSGNPGGRPKTKPFRDALMMEAKLAEEGEECFAKPGSLRWNARQLLKQGDVQSIKELADRLDGKVPQGVIGGDEDDNPIVIRATIGGAHAPVPLGDKPTFDVTLGSDGLIASAVRTDAPDNG